MVTMQDVRAAKLCVWGAKKWCAHHGFDFVTLIEIGLPADAVEATGDGYGRRVVEEARRREYMREVEEDGQI